MLNLSKFKITQKGLYWGLIFTFALLYLCVGFVSTLHSITFFNLANTLGLAVLLGVTYELGQASVLFGILMTKKDEHKVLPWALMVLLTGLQVTANVYSSFKYMATSGSNDWQFWQKSILFGVQAANAEMYQVIISWIAGALLPIVALGMTALVAQNMNFISEEGQKQEPIDSNEPDLIIAGLDAIAESRKNAEISDDMDEEIKSLTPEFTKSTEKQFEKDFIEPEKKASDKPLKPKRGWHLKKKFVDSNGDIYSYGKLSSKPIEPKKA